MVRMEPLTPLQDNSTNVDGLDGASVKEILSELMKQNQLLTSRLQEHEKALWTNQRTLSQTFKKYISNAVLELKGEVSRAMLDLREEISSAVQELKDEIIEQTPDVGDLEAQIEETIQDQCQNIHAELGAIYAQQLAHARKSAITNIQLRREIAHLRRQLNTSTQQVPQFSQLPLELRTLIWELALPRRLFCEDRSGEIYGVDFRLRVPAIAHVCHESRQVALRHGMLLPVEGSTADTGWSWLIPNRDLVLIRPTTGTVAGQVVENVLVECEETLLDSETSSTGLASYFGRLDLGNPKAFLKLKTIYVLMTSPTYVDKSWHPHIVSKFFKGDSVVLFPLDKGEPTSVIALLKQSMGLKEPGLHLKFDVENAASSLSSSCSAYNTSWDRVKQIFLRLFIRARLEYNPVSLGVHEVFDDDLNPNLDVPWVKCMVESVELRPIHLFTLLDGELYPQSQKID